MSSPELRENLPLSDAEYETEPYTPEEVWEWNMDAMEVRFNEEDMKEGES